jgi:hypothetical protein
VGLGVFIGLLCACLYLVLALAIETFWPTILDAPIIGAYFAILCIAAPISGGLAAYFGYRF